MIGEKKHMKVAVIGCANAGLSLRALTFMEIAERKGCEVTVVNQSRLMITGHTIDKILIDELAIKKSMNPPKKRRERRFMLRTRKKRNKSLNL